MTSPNFFTYCWVCGTQIVNETDPCARQPAIANENRAWKDKWIRQGRKPADSFSLQVKAGELDRSFDDERLASSLFRMVVVNRGTPAVYYLSGIAQLPGAAVSEDGSCLKLVIPESSDQACIGKIFAGDSAQAVWLIRHGSSVDERTSALGRYLAGYPIHARCWSLAERCADEWDSLETLISKLTLKWTEISIDEGWIRDRPMPYKKCYADPVFIDGIREVIKEGAGLVKQTRGLTRRQRQVNRLTLAGRLPIELWHLVIGQLGGEDLCNCAVALGNDVASIIVGNEFPKHVFLEAHELGLDESIDWKHVHYLLLERGFLGKPTAALWHRQQIMGLLMDLPQVR